MVDTKNLINRKLCQFLSHEISQKTLFEWSVSFLHKMIGDDDLDIERMEVWGIITKLTEIGDMDVRFCKELVCRLQRILSGSECASFTFAMKIPPKYVRSKLLRVKEIFAKYVDEKNLRKEDVQELRLIISTKKDEIITVNDFLENHILSLLELGYDLLDDEDSIAYGLKSTLYISEGMEDLEGNLLTEVMALIRCYEGKAEFFVHVNYRNGRGNISIHT